MTFFVAVFLISLAFSLLTDLKWLKEAGSGAAALYSLLTAAALFLIIMLSFRIRVPMPTYLFSTWISPWVESWLGS